MNADISEACRSQVLVRDLGRGRNRPMVTRLMPGLERWLRAEIAGGVLFDAFSRGRYATDASHYQMLPLGIVLPKTIPEADKKTLLAAAAGVEKRLQVEVPKQDENAVAAMTKAGLTVTKATGPEWRVQLDNLATTMRGEQVPPDIFDQASKARDEFRKKKTVSR